MMDCLEAQELVSAALDNEIADPGALERAKDHCRTCPECASYVRALVLVRRAKSPEPPADLADRIITTVRAQAQPTPTSAQVASDVGNAAAVVPVPGQGLAEPSPSVSTTVVSRRLMERLTDPRHRRAVVAWSAAAAVVFIAAGFGAVAGVRTIMSPRAVDGGVALTYDTGAEVAREAAPGATSESPAAAQMAAPEAADAPGSVPSNGFIAVDGVVYRSTGVDGSVTRGALSPQGATDTALDTGTPPTRRTVYGRGEPARVFIELDDGSMLGFDRVTTTFGGNTYVLRSGPITAFDQPVTLPSDVPEPSSSDGRPVFELADPALQPPVYILVGSDPSRGIALPAGARPEIGAGWTWWTPAATE